MKQLEILLLDDHIAALDQKATEQVVELTERRIAQNNLTSLMMTHNTNHAIRYGNRLIMMYKGRVVLDISEVEKDKLPVSRLISLFNNKVKDEMINNDVLLY